MNPQALVDALPGQILTVDNVTSARKVYAAAQTNAAVIAAVAGRRIVVVGCDAMCDDDNTNDTAVLIGFHATVTPTASDVVLTHPGVPAGSGVMKIMGAGKPIEVGGVGVPLLITSGDPGGTLEILVTYFLS